MSTAAQTVIAGVLIFVGGQLFLKLVIEPTHQLKKTIASVSHTLFCYSYVIHNPTIVSTTQYDEVDGKLREISGQLVADMSVLPACCVFGWIFRLPRRKDIFESAQNLINIANTMASTSESKFDDIDRYKLQIYKSLGIYAPNYD